MSTPLGSRYELIEQIASGATGSVWRGQVRETGEAVAVKQIKAELATDADVVDRFLRERRVLSSIDHPAVVRIRDMVVEGDRLGLVMDLVEGTDLRHRLARSGPLPPADAVALVATIADGLAAAHAAGVVHADVKPANVLVPADGSSVRLADFGVARLIRGPAPTSFGTPEYIAPEVISGHASIPSSDVYGAAIMLYELLTGTTPYRGGSSAEVMQRHIEARPIWTAAVPEVLRPILLGCLNRDPRRRPSAETLAADLRATLDGLEGHPVGTALPVGTPHYLMLPPAGALEAVEPDDRATDFLAAGTAAAVTPLPGTPAPALPASAASPLPAPRPQAEVPTALSAKRAGDPVPPSDRSPLPVPPVPVPPVPVPPVPVPAPAPLPASHESPAPGALDAFFGQPDEDDADEPYEPVVGWETPGPSAAAASEPGPAPTTVVQSPFQPGGPDNIAWQTPGYGNPNAGTPNAGSPDAGGAAPEWGTPVWRAPGVGEPPPPPPPSGRSAGRRRLPLLIGLIAAGVVAIVAIGVGVAWSGILSGDDKSPADARDSRPASSAPSAGGSTTVTPTPGAPTSPSPSPPDPSGSPSGDTGAGPTQLPPDVPTDDPTTGVPTHRMPSFPTQIPGEPSIGGPIG